MGAPCYPPRGLPPMIRSLDTSRLLVPLGGLVDREVDLDAYLQVLMDKVAAALQADRGTLYLLDPSRGDLFSRAAHLPEVSQIRVKKGQGVAGRVAETGVPHRSGDGPRFDGIDKLTGYHTHSSLAVPLRDRHGGLFGVLQVLNRRGAPVFTDEDEARLVSIAAQVASALEATSLYAELERARAQPDAPVGWFFNRIVGESATMQQAYRVASKAAATEATVLLRGESGTGKELFARALHVNSPRKDRPYVKVDCAALPAGLLENELFGHEKGAFTGADSRQAGRFEAATGGTVFIDELGELPLAAQGKLLRVLQDRELERLGGHDVVKVDVRIVAATHRDLGQMVREGRFRADLYYRVRVVELQLPPLRERGAEDIERLARHFLAAAARRHHVSPVPQLADAAVARILSWRWPGNVRELENCIESAVILCDGVIQPEHLPMPGVEAAGREQPGEGVSASPAPGETVDETLAAAERRHVLSVLARHGGNQSAAARALAIGRNTLIRKLREWNVPANDGP